MIEEFIADKLNNIATEYGLPIVYRNQENEIAEGLIAYEIVETSPVLELPEVESLEQLTLQIDILINKDYEDLEKQLKGITLLKSIKKKIYKTFYNLKIRYKGNDYYFFYMSTLNQFIKDINCYYWMITFSIKENIIKEEEK